MKLKSITILAVMLATILGSACGKVKAKAEESPENSSVQAEQPKPLPEGAIAFDYASHLYFDVVLRDSIPARMIFAGKKKTEAPCENDLDQIHIPDPVSQEFCRLNAKIERLEKELDTRKQEEDARIEDCKKIATDRLESLGLKVTFGKHVMEADSDYLCASPARLPGRTGH